MFVFPTVVKIYFIFHVISEEPSQHVQSDSATSNLPDKCPMTGANLQACHCICMQGLISNIVQFLMAELERSEQS